MQRLREFKRVHQREGEPQRRWFTSAALDLYVWFDEQEEPIGFQFCYDKHRAERALTWFEQTGFSHMRIDDGEAGSDLRHKRSPVMTPDGDLDLPRVRRLFTDAAADLPDTVVRYVLAQIVRTG